jgi:hypothetical protein
MFVTVQESLVRAHHHHAIAQAHRGCEGVLLSLVMMVMVVMMQQVGRSSIDVGQHG